MNLSKQLKVSIKKKYDNTCFYCGCRNKILMEVDHLQPLSRGGSHKPENLVCSCQICNKLKGNMTEKEFQLYTNSISKLYELGKFELKVQTMSQNINLSNGKGRSVWIPKEGAEQ